jgi:predicted nucleotide-binding protein (sugar kinase/HSP70/actin superfamily)
MKIGLPRALLYYRYGQLWQRFLTSLGAEVIISPKTDEAILNKGLACVSSEVCLPIKIVAGHLIELKDKVDAIFFPRLEYLRDGLYACPKMIGVVDVARMLLADQVQILSPTIRGNFVRAHIRAGLEICPNPFRVFKAWHQSSRSLVRRTTNQELETKAGKVAGVVGVISHFYNLGDEFISAAIIKTFIENGYQILTKEDLPAPVLLDRQGFAQNIRWVYERELFSAFEFLLGRVDGFCMVVSMGCGPDSLVAEFIRERAQAESVPFLLLVIDEHTGTAGLVTRVEAFIELLNRRKRSSASRCRAA